MDRLSVPSIPARTTNAIGQCVAEHCRAAGVDPLPLLRRANIEPQDLHDPNGRIRVAAQVALFRLAADALGDGMLGFRLAETMDLRRVGLYYFVLASSATVGEALERVGRYCSLYNESLRMERLSGDESGIRYTCAGIARHTDRHQMEFWATYLVRMARELTGTRATPIRASFIHARCPGSGELEGYFACPVTFGSVADEGKAPKKEWEALPSSALRKLCDEIEIILAEWKWTGKGRVEFDQRTKEPPRDVATGVHYEWFAGDNGRLGERIAFFPPGND